MKHLLPITLLGLAVASCSAPTTPEIDDHELAWHVRWLSNDQREGRMTGSVQMVKASHYIREDFRDSGLVPAGDDGGWFQYFEVEMPPEEGNSTLTVGSTSWTEVGTVAASGGNTSVAPLVADLGSADGKHVLLRRDGGKNLRAQVREALDAGAIGVVIGWHPMDLMPGQPDAIPFDSARGDVDLPVITIESGLLVELENRIAAAGADGLAGARLLPHVIREKRTARNVMAMAPGTTDEVIVVGAHYDHLGFGGPGSLAPGIHAVHNGADDNASGTAMVMELAEMWGLSEVGPKPRERGILFCLWSGEEMGLLGSAHWVANPTVPLENVVCNVNLDMVGRLEKGVVTVGSAQTAAVFGPALEHAQGYLEKIDAEVSLKVLGGEMPGGGGSDHMSFHKVGIPALFFFSGMHADYHKPSDDWPKLSYGRMAELGIGIAALLVELQMAPREEFEFQKPEAPDPHSGGNVSRHGPRLWFGSVPDYGASPDAGGMLISGTSAGSPAEKAGLMAGDLLTKVGDVEVGDIYDFMDALGKYENGDTIVVEFVRGGEEMEVELTFFPRP